MIYLLLSLSLSHGTPRCAAGLRKSIEEFGQVRSYAPNVLVYEDAHFPKHDVSFEWERDAALAYAKTIPNEGVFLISYHRNSAVSRFDGYVYRPDTDELVANLSVKVVKKRRLRGGAKISQVVGDGIQKLKMVADPFGVRPRSGARLIVHLETMPFVYRATLESIRDRLAVSPHMDSVTILKGGEALVLKASEPTPKAEWVRFK